MKLSFVFVAVLAGVHNAGATRAVRRESLEVGSPVEKVVTLLRDMQARVKEDEKREQFMYDKYACWCEKTTARKAKAIEDAKIDLRRIGQDILGLRGKIATLIAEIQQLTIDMKENEKSQAEATSIRQKENEEYMAESMEMKEALAALEKAVVVLADATSSSSAALLQKQETTTEAEVSRRLKDAISALPVRALSAVPPQKLSLLRSYAADLIQGKARYAPQSMTVQGILRNMYDTFGTDLQDMIIAEGTKNRDYEDLMATLQEELAIMQESVQKKTKDKAESEVLLAEATQTYDDTEEQMKADIKFFDATKETCSDNADKWEERQKVRKEELEAIDKAVEVLSSDEARELFDKSIKPGMETFLQVDQTNEDEAAMRGKKAYEVLKTQASKTRSLRLARLAAQVRLAKAGHFDAVIVDIDKLIKDHQAEQGEDDDKQQQCKDEYASIKRTIADLLWKIEVNDRNIQKLEDEIEKSEEEKEKTIKEIKITEETIAELKKVRKEENEAFLQAKKEDEDAIKLLDQAKEIMADFYNKHDIEIGPIQGERLDFLQSWYVQGPEFAVGNDTAPEFKFSDKGHRGKTQGKGVLSLLAIIQQDLADEITNSMAAEEAAQLDFEKVRDAAEAYLEELKTKKTNLETTIARLKKEKGEEETDKTKNEAALKDEKDYKTRITPDCDFILGRFEERMAKRTAEMDGLKQAKDFLSGYKENWSGGAIEAPVLAQRQTHLRH